MNFFSELKRRNVIRAGGLYLVGAWLLVQVAGTILSMFGAPDALYVESAIPLQTMPPPRSVMLIWRAIHLPPVPLRQRDR